MGSAGRCHVQELGFHSTTREHCKGACSHLKDATKNLVVGKGRVDSTLKRGGCEQRLAVPLDHKTPWGCLLLRTRFFPVTEGCTPERALKQLVLLLLSGLTSRGAEDG